VTRTGWLRAAVLGANDGLLSTSSLMVGVAAAAAGPAQVILTGVAGLVAGAMSMAAGEFVSVSSQADSETAGRRAGAAGAGGRPRSRTTRARRDLRPARIAESAGGRGGRDPDRAKCAGGTFARRTRHYGTLDRKTDTGCARVRRIVSGWRAPASPHGDACANCGRALGDRRDRNHHAWGAGSGRCSRRWGTSHSRDRPRRLMGFARHGGHCRRRTLVSHNNRLKLLHRVH
jgi:hypothetical protein